jgi:uncharacterized protein YdbL (DUF1318 family)
MKCIAQAFLVIAMSLLIFVGSASAIELADAKNQGLVGETTSGYLAPVAQQPKPEVKALVEEINTKRRVEYLKIAQKNNTEVATVEALAGKKAIERTPAGQFVQSRPGVWDTK